MTAETPQELVARLRGLMERATLAPWKLRDGHWINIQGSPVEGERYGDEVTTHTGAVAKQRGYGRDNAALIVAAVNALPQLLALIEVTPSAADAWRAGRAEPAGCPTPGACSCLPVPAPFGGDGWLPIKTAPRDGTNILVCVTHSLGNDTWETIQWGDWARASIAWPVYWQRVDIPFSPTHWRPLLAPPRGDDGEEG